MAIPTVIAANQTDLDAILGNVVSRSGERCKHYVLVLR